MYQRIVPVYRLYQSTMTSPCVLGSPCPSCVQQALCRTAGYPCRSCRRGRHHICERASFAQPAFYVSVRYALDLIRNGLARFVNRNTAIQLTFADVTPLRDQSCNVDLSVILPYIEGSIYTRLVVDLGWSLPPLAIEKACPLTPIYPFV